MTETTTNKVEFIAYHQPVLPDGDYQITVTQSINFEDEPFSTTQDFTVSGPRFALAVDDVASVFPPAESLGDHDNVLPHIIFNRSTIPWERELLTATASTDEVQLMDDETGEPMPWLALLLFTEAEKPEPQNVRLKTLLDGSEDPNFPNITLETTQSETDTLTVIDVEREVLEALLPTWADLPYLAHVRQVKDETGGDERAIIIGNRLPEAGAISTVHLVSLEGRYTVVANEEGVLEGTFDFGAEEAALIRLVSLKSWRFACVDEAQSFKGLALNLDSAPTVLRLPENNDEIAEAYLAGGFVPAPHTLRQGSQTVSWYHGPLIPGDNISDSFDLPAKAADQLVRYNPTTGMFDVSYAAAWELGRLLALQSKQFSVSLYNWKRNCAQRERQTTQQNDYTHLPLDGATTDAIDHDATTTTIQTWLNDLSLLAGVPFNYLVPHVDMLPEEAIRFFWIDPRWVDCLLDGAFSIGRLTTADYARDRDLFTNVDPSLGEITGVLIRSNLVSGWPDLQVNGYDRQPDLQESISSDHECPLLRMVRLSDTVLLCLFEGEIQTVDVHQKPEALHFGLDREDSGLDQNQDALPYYKELRNSDGVESGDIFVSREDILWRPDSLPRIIEIAELATEIKTTITENPELEDDGASFSSAQFALQMIEGVEKVRFMTGGD